MQLEETFTLPFEREIVWQAFQNIELLVNCLPGAKLLSEPTAQPMNIDFHVKLGPIQANFSGLGIVNFDFDHYCGTFSGQGNDPKSNSRVKGEAQFTLITLSKHETQISVNTDFFLTGALAQFGRVGLVKEVASIITAQFAENLKNHLNPVHFTNENPDASFTDLNHTEITSTQKNHAKKDSSLSIFKLITDLIKNQIKKIFSTHNT